MGPPSEFPNAGGAASGLIASGPFTRDCKGNFAVQNVGGALNATAAVTFDQSAGPCFWDVTADGAWGITAK